MSVQGQMMVLREQNHVAPEPNHVDVSRNRHLVKCFPVTQKSGLTLQRVFRVCLVASRVVPLSKYPYLALYPPWIIYGHSWQNSDHCISFYLGLPRTSWRARYSGKLLNQVIRHSKSSLLTWVKLLKDHPHKSLFPPFSRVLEVTLDCQELQGMM